MIELNYEKTISTVEDAAQTAARIFESQFEQKRQSYFAEPPTGGQEALDPRLTPHVRMADEPAKRLRFDREARIKQGRDFARVREKGERRVMGCLIANWRRSGVGSDSRLGVITSAKIGNAVVRTRARRLLREAFRLHQNELSEPLDLVLVARASIVGKSFAQVEKDFLTTLGKAGLLKPVSG